jgi:hypothetical protein
MMALLVRPRGPVLGLVRISCFSSFLAFAVALGLAAIAVPANASDISVVLDHDTLVKVPERASTIVIGNPMIVGVTLQPGGLLVLTGKSYGTTNLIALDRTGAVLTEKTIEVFAPRDTVVVYRGTNRETYTCAPNCEPRIMLGDSQAHFAITLGQAVGRNDQAQGMAASR